MEEREGLKTKGQEIGERPEASPDKGLELRGGLGLRAERGRVSG